MAEKIAGTIATFVTLASVGIAGWLILLVSWLFYKVAERFRFGGWKIKQTFWRWCRYSAVFTFGLCLSAVFLAEEVDVTQASSPRERSELQATEVVTVAVSMWLKVIVFLVVAHLLIVFDLLAGLVRGKYPTDDPEVDGFS